MRPERGRRLRPPQRDVRRGGRQWRRRGPPARLDPGPTTGLAGCGFGSLLQQLQALGRNGGALCLKGRPGP